MWQVAMLDNANAQRLVLPACVKMSLLVVELASGSGTELLMRPPALGSGIHQCLLLSVLLLFLLLQTVLVVLTLQQDE